MLQKFVDEKFPKWAKAVLCIIGGAAAVYRIFEYVDACIAKSETKNTKALVWGIICIIPLVGIVVGVIDLISLLKSNEFSKVCR